MKILTFLVLFFFIGLNNTSANTEIIIFDNFPRLEQMENFQEIYDLNPSILGNYKIYYDSGVFYGIAQVSNEHYYFCGLQGYKYISHTLGGYSEWSLSFSGTSLTSGNATYISQNFNVIGGRTTLYKSITCEKEIPEIQTIIDYDPGINKQVFDSETIEEFYKIQASLMMFILFIYFFYRLIKQNSAPRNIFKRK